MVIWIGDEVGPTKNAGQRGIPHRSAISKKRSGPKRRVRVEGSALTFRTRWGQRVEGTVLGLPILAAGESRLRLLNVYTPLLKNLIRNVSECTNAGMNCRTRGMNGDESMLSELFRAPIQSHNFISFIHSFAVKSRPLPEKLIEARPVATTEIQLRTVAQDDHVIAVE